MVVVIALAARFDIPGGFRIYSVLTGSMEPAVPTKALIVTKIPRALEDIQNGQIITFTQPGYENKFVTHRVVAIKEQGTVRTFTTKGDSNQATDSWEIPYGMIRGVYAFHIPYLGSFLEFLKSRIGIVVLILIPCLILAGKELKTIWNTIFEIKLSKMQKTSDGQAPKNDQPALKKKHIDIVHLVLIFCLALILSGIKSTNALFTTHPATMQNISLGVGSNIEQSIVINEVYYDLCTPVPEPMCGNPAKNNWVELYNPTAIAIDLTGWKLETITGSNTHSDTLPSGATIPAGGFLVVTPEADTFDFWPGVPVSQRVILGDNIGNGLQPNGDNLRLKDDSGTIVDAISYGLDTSVLSPSITDVASGHSVERDPDGTDTDSSGNFVDRTAPQPGI